MWRAAFESLRISISVCFVVVGLRAVPLFFLREKEGSKDVRGAKFFLAGSGLGAVLDFHGSLARGPFVFSPILPTFAVLVLQSEK